MPGNVVMALYFKGLQGGISKLRYGTDPVSILPVSSLFAKVLRIKRLNSILLVGWLTV